MDPRLSSSLKWTHLPQELRQQIIGIFNENFSKQLKDYKFIFEGRIYKEELLLRAGLIEDDRIRQYNFEISITINPKKKNALKTIHLGIDCLGALLSQFFAGERFDEFPKYWQEQDVEGQKIFFQTSAVNTDLEAQANALLGELEDDMVMGEDEEELRQQVIHMLGLSEDDDEGEK